MRISVKPWTRAPAALALALLALAAVLIINTVRLPDPPPAQARPTAPPPDLDGASRRLSAAIRIATVSAGPDAPGAENNFPAFHRMLAESFPLTHAALRRETVNGDSLLYTWQGSDASLPPMLLTAHMDTVPVEPGTENKWSHPPFSGALADGFIWGRGTLDMKHAVMASLEGVERLLAQGYRPRRTILLAFGADEETGGARGAARIVALLRQRQVRAWFSLDEGSVILDGFIPGASRPIAQVGIAEKGYVSLALVARADGGHSSMPPPLTAVGRIARAVARLEAQPMPASLDGPGGAGLRAMAPVLPVAARMALANQWLLDPLIKRQLAAVAATDALIRTTTAPTVIGGGVKDNVLPAEARAIVNFRLVPGDSIARVMAHAQAVIDDSAVTIAVYGALANEPTAVADVASPGYRALSRALASVAPDALVVPGLVVAGTDSRHYGEISDAALRFLPVRMTPADVARIHGSDERIGIANYGELIAFYEALMREAR